MAQTRPSPTLSRGFTRLGRFLAPYGFGQLERRGVFTSVTELREEIRRFIEAHNMHAAKPFRWTKSASAILDAVERARETLNKETSRTGH